MAQTLLGLDLGARAVKAIRLQTSYRGFAVAGEALAPVPAAVEGGPDLLGRQLEALRALLADRRWRADTTVCALPGAGVAAHAVTLPFTDPRRIEQTVGFEVEAAIPFELDAAAWDYQPVAVRGDATELWVGVARREELARLLEALAAEGIDPRAVVPAAPALASLLAPGVLEEAPAPPGEAPVEAILDVGEERTLLCVGAGGALLAARAIATGGAAVARALAAARSLPPEEAARLLAPGAPSLPGDDAAFARALDPIARELRATLTAWRARAGARPVTRLWLAGGLARRPELAARLAGEVEGPVAPLALVGAAAAGVPADRAPSLALALALALRGAQGSRAGRLNLRRGALAYARDLQHLRGKIARLAGAVALTFLLGLASSGVKLAALAREERALDRALCDAQEKVLSRCYPNYEEALSALHGRGLPGAGVPRTSAVDALAALVRAMPDGLSFRFDRVDLTDRKLHLQGVTDAAEGVDRLVTAVRGDRCFADARSGGARKRSSDGKFEFSIDAGIACGGRAAGGE